MFFIFFEFAGWFSVHNFTILAIFKGSNSTDIFYCTYNVCFICTCNKIFMDNKLIFIVCTIKSSVDSIHFFNF